MENMDNAYRMRDAHKRMKQSEEMVHPVTDGEMELGEHDRTLSQIMQDKKEQNRFINRFCFEKDPERTKEIVETLAAGTLLTAEQDTFLEKVHGEYNLRRAEIEQIREMLTPEEMQRIAGLDPRIQEVMGKIGPEKTVGLLGKEFEDLAMSDSSAFKKVVRKWASLPTCAPTQRWPSSIGMFRIRCGTMVYAKKNIGRRPCPARLPKHRGTWTSS